MRRTQPSPVPLRTTPQPTKPLQPKIHLVPLLPAVLCDLMICTTKILSLRTMVAPITVINIFFWQQLSSLILFIKMGCTLQTKLHKYSKVLELIHNICTNVSKLKLKKVWGHWQFLNASPLFLIWKDNLPLHFLHHCCNFLGRFCNPWGISDNKTKTCVPDLSAKTRANTKHCKK